METNSINEAITELRTIRDLLRWSVSQFNAANLFYGHGTDNALDEAVAIIFHALHLPYEINPQVLDARVTTSERRQIMELVRRRVEDYTPAAYLTHEAWFAGYAFYVDERVLIPRSPIAELVEQHFTPWVEEEKVVRILDLCTGSGCIAIACAMAFPQAIVDAVDISTEALEVAKINVDRYGLHGQVHLITSDLFAEIPARKYDLIVSNPPYVSHDEMINIPAEFQHEPELGLIAGAEGLDFAIRILQEAENHLTAEGVLILEVGDSEFALRKRFPQVPFTWLEFQRGGGGVFLLTADQLRASAKYF